MISSASTSWKPTCVKNCNEAPSTSVGTTHDRGWNKVYENVEAGLGAYFLNSKMTDLRSLSIYAGVHQKYDPQYFRMVCKRFPYSIYYRMDGSDVDIYAVLDDRRDPGSIYNTLESLLDVE